MKKIIQLTCMVLICWFPAQGQDWLVPDDQASLQNPSAYSLNNVKRGKEMYMQHCKSCHGDPGKNNSLPLVPLPPDLTSEVMQRNSDGGLFYKITAGRGGMPQFATTISEDDRWRLVNFIRNYSPVIEPLLVDAPPVNAKILASVNEREARVEVLAEFEEKPGTYLELANTPVYISSKKAFGNLMLGQVLTDTKGRAYFSIPETVIGDEEGYMSIVVSLDENYKADAVVLEKARVGKSKEVPKLISREVLWSTNENIQLWLLLSYIGAAGAAWITIGYVVWQIVKIKRYSRD
jgi:cytochrome c5